jgi:hypothetical protein
MADPLATVATYWSLEDCAVHRTALDAAAIENFVDDYFVVNIDWLWANLMRGIKLRVPREKLDEAAEVIEGASEIGEPEAFEEPADECESCGAATFDSTQKWLKFAAVAVVVVGAAIAVHQVPPALFIVLAALLMTIIAPRRRCTECGEPS